MVAPRKFDLETRERGVRVYQDRITQTGDSKRGARRCVGEILGINEATLRNWVENRYGSGDCSPAGEGSMPGAELKALRRENAELRRTDEILKTATAFFAAAEVDRGVR